MGHAFSTRHIEEKHGAAIAPLFRIFGHLDAAWSDHRFSDSARCRRMAGQRRPANGGTAIAVLSGNIPTRALQATRLYHDGYAKEIWLTHRRAHADVLEVLGIYYPRESDFNVWVLREHGVPAKAIHVLDVPIVNTAEELDVISAALKPAQVNHELLGIMNAWAVKLVPSVVLQFSHSLRPRYPPLRIYIGRGNLLRPPRNQV
jgi:hypothetical protein